MHKWILMLLAAAAACSSGTEPGKPAPTSGSLTVIIDSLDASKVGGIHFQGSDGVDHYVQAKPGANTLLAGAAFGTYRLQLDTVWFADSSPGIFGFNYDGSRWTANPIAADRTISSSKADDTLRVVYRKATGGIKVIATDPMPDGFWVTFIPPGGGDCHCMPGGQGPRAADSLTVQNLLPGQWKLAFLAQSHFTGHGPAQYTVVPDQDTVVVNVVAGQITRAPKVTYRVQ